MHEEAKPMSQLLVYEKLRGLFEKKHERDGDEPLFPVVSWPLIVIFSLWRRVLTKPRQSLKLQAVACQ
jgi:hypothetical protein